ncbi:hypothetical protein [Treponema denticola]|nr:hypothetical protein [Treponema denticola]
MKKLLKILTITAALLTTIILTACKQFLDDPEELVGGSYPFEFSHK